MTRTLVLLLLLIPACSTAPTALDVGSIADGDSRSDAIVLRDDSGPPPDAVVIGPDGEVIPVDAGTDAASPGDAFVSPADDSGIDATVAPIDGGHDAATFSGDAWPGSCGDGFIDPPETCDPAYTGGVHNSISCPAAGSTDACRWCHYGLTDAGCVYGDYLSGSAPANWTVACHSTTSDLSWVTWHSMAERDAVIAAYRSIGASGGTTSVTGWIGLRATSDTASFAWSDDGSALTSGTILPIHNTRGVGANCMSLTVTDTDAFFMYVSCSGGGGRVALCFTQRWGATR